MSVILVHARCHESTINQEFLVDALVRTVAATLL